MSAPSRWPLSIIIVGGSYDLRASLRAMLRQEQDFFLEGEAGTGAAGLDLALRGQPDVALVTVCLPDRSGFEVVKCMKQLAPACVAIMLSNAPDPHVEEVARLLGAKEVWHKGKDLGQLRQTLQGLFSTVLNSRVAESSFPWLAS